MALRKDQLTNVGFGGEWSEQIERRELLLQVIRILEAAVEDCAEEDQRTDQTKAALDVIRGLAEFNSDVLPDAEEEDAKPRGSTAVSKDLQFLLVAKRCGLSGAGTR